MRTSLPVSKHSCSIEPLDVQGNTCACSQNLCRLVTSPMVGFAWHYFESWSTSQPMPKKRTLVTEDHEAIAEEVRGHFRDFLAAASLNFSGGNKMDSIVTSWARECAECVEKSVGMYVDMMTEALLARGNKVDSRLQLQITAKGLSFGTEQLCDWMIHGSWLAHHIGESIPGEIPPGVREEFRIELLSTEEEWLWEAQRRIHLRILLMGLIRPPIRKRKHEFLRVKLFERFGIPARPNFKKMCVYLDVYNSRVKNKFPPLDEWQEKTKDRTWVGNYRHKSTGGSVSSFLSKLVRETRENSS